MNRNILHFLRSYGYHGGEKQIYKITQTNTENYKHFFIDLHYNIELKNKYNNSLVKYNYLLPFNLKNINLYI